ncbi:hypothetical protein PoB_005180200 [Plakobranchus ocellatus]|uniref:Uncharacterized protein n=1 Tax=Plakobranchus ocellatus TaxID=259542 RepID=A0AAV4C1S3_9GAST|nr:hypothetical protein PoB_005180200 [Plakobranchus ocellatus]
MVDGSDRHVQLDLPATRSVSRRFWSEGLVTWCNLLAVRFATVSKAVPNLQGWSSSLLGYDLGQFFPHELNRRHVELVFRQKNAVTSYWLRAQKPGDGWQ